MILLLTLVAGQHEIHDVYGNRQVLVFPKEDTILDSGIGKSQTHQYNMLAMKMVRQMGRFF
jgi:hypothetical protein